MVRTILETKSLKVAMASGSDWAREAGARVRKRRLQLGLTVRQVSAVIDVPVQTIYRVESGQLIIKDYLRLAIAHALATEVTELFEMPSCERVAEIVAVPCPEPVA